MKEEKEYVPKWENYETERKENRKHEQFCWKQGPFRGVESYQTGKVERYQTGAFLIPVRESTKYQMGG